MAPKFNPGDRVQYTRKDGVAIHGTVHKVHTKSACKTRQELGVFYNPQLLGEEFAYGLRLSEEHAAIVGHPVTVGETRLRGVEQ